MAGRWAQLDPDRALTMTRDFRDEALEARVRGGRTTSVGTRRAGPSFRAPERIRHGIAAGRAVRCRRCRAGTRGPRAASGIGTQPLRRVAADSGNHGAAAARRSRSARPRRGTSSACPRAPSDNVRAQIVARGVRQARCRGRPRVGAHAAGTTECRRLRDRRHRRRRPRARPGPSARADVAHGTDARGADSGHERREARRARPRPSRTGSSPWTIPRCKTRSRSWSCRRGHRARPTARCVGCLRTARASLRPSSNRSVNGSRCGTRAQQPPMQRRYLLRLVSRGFRAWRRATAQNDPQGAIDWLRGFSSEPWYGARPPRHSRRRWRNATAPRRHASSMSSKRAQRACRRSSSSAPSPSTGPTAIPRRRPSGPSIARTEQERTLAVRNVIGTWSAQDMNGARQWTLQLPQGALRDSALTTLLTMTVSRASTRGRRRRFERVHVG